ncbi:MAG: aminotransferase class III-fold pyridoxal phosphate-dependent enzyme [Alphaproteobacteria bacterium]|nr:MAG: aminotransferase class III-fold pyridoxal phosphate-dependent enzyme [Alphaproteobacteria bacterium]
MAASLPANIDIAAALLEAEELYQARNPKSLAQHRAACAAMPGGNTRSAIHVDPFPLTMVRGEGARLWDLDGHEYVDFLSEFTAGIYGHSHPTILRTIAAALEGGLNFGAHNATEARFATAICARFPSIDLERFTNSGTEANLMAVSAAVAITGRPKIPSTFAATAARSMRRSSISSAATTTSLRSRRSSGHFEPSSPRSSSSRCRGPPAASRPSAIFSPGCAPWRTRPGRC